MVRATSKMCLCLRSATPFCWDVWEQAVWWIIPFLEQKKTHHFSYIIGYLSVRSTQIEVENWVFISLWKSSMTPETSDLSFSKYRQVIGEKSSTKMRKYLKSLDEGTRLEPQTSEWTNSNAELLRLLIRLRKETWCLPISKDARSSVEKEDSIEIIDRNFCNEGWPKRQC